MIYENEIFKYFTYITPFKFSTGIVLESWNASYDGIKILENGDLTLTFIESNVFDIKKDFISINLNDIQNINTQGRFLAFNKVDKILNLTISYVWFAVFFLISVKKFKWSVRE